MMCWVFGIEHFFFEPFAKCLDIGECRHQLVAGNM